MTSKKSSIVKVALALLTSMMTCILFCHHVAARQSAMKVLPQAGDRVTVVSDEGTPIPLPAEVVSVIKGKAIVQMLPSFQYKGGEQRKVSLRQIKAIFPADKVNVSETSTAPASAPTSTTDVENNAAGTKSRIVKLQGNARAGERAKVLSGLFTRFGQSFEGKKLICKEEQFYFYPDGHVYHGIPPEGPSHLDWQKASATNANLCGTYGIDGDTIIFKWGSQAQTMPATTWSIKRKGLNIELNGLVADKSPEFIHSTLSGTYLRQSVKLVNGKSVLHPESYVFADDNSVIYVGDGKKSGRYLLAGNDLQIKFENGEIFYCTAFPQYLDSRNSKSPPRISLAGNLYELQQIR